MMYRYGHGHAMGAWGWFAMSTAVVLVTALVVVIGVAVYHAWSGQRPSAPVPEQSRPAAESVLAQRFARGEIDEDEYRSRLAVLRSGDVPDRRGGH